MPTITFPPLADVTFAPGLTVALGATSSDSAPVSYCSSDTSIATVANSTVTVVTAGTVTLTASASGTSTTQDLVIHKAPQNLSMSGLADKVVGDAPFTLSPTSSAGLTSFSATSSNAAVATASGVTITPGAAGVSTITVTEPGDACYLPGEWEGVLTVEEPASDNPDGEDDVEADLADGTQSQQGDASYVAGEVAGGQKYVRLEVPNYDESGTTHPLSYIQMGAARTDGDELRRGDDLLSAVGLTASANHFFRDDWRSSNSQQHPQTKYHRQDGVADDNTVSPQTLTSQLRTRGGWREHTDGNRITTTRGDRIEVIGGNYRMVVLGRLWQRSGCSHADNGFGVSYWESSGGHNKDGTNTPGEVVSIVWKGSEDEQNDSYQGTWKTFEETIKGKVISRYTGNQYEWYECDRIHDTIGSEDSVGNAGSEPTIEQSSASGAQEQTDQETKWLNAPGRKKINPDITESTKATTIDTKTKATGILATIDEYEVIRQSKTATTTIGGKLSQTTFAGVLTDEKGFAWSKDQPKDGSVTYTSIHKLKESLFGTTYTNGEYGLVKLEVATGAMHWSNGGMGFTLNLGASAGFTLGIDTGFSLATLDIGLKVALATSLEMSAALEATIGLKFKYATKKDGIGMTSTQLTMLQSFNHMKKTEMAVANKVTTFFKNLT